MIPKTCSKIFNIFKPWNILCVASQFTALKLSSYLWRHIKLLASSIIECLCKCVHILYTYKIYLGWKCHHICSCYYKHSSDCLTHTKIMNQTTSWAIAMTVERDTTNWIFMYIFWYLNTSHTNFIGVLDSSNWWKYKANIKKCC